MEKFKTYEEYIPKLIAFFKRFAINLDLKNPKTISDKINWLKIYHSTPLKARCADKVLLHDYCKEKLGKDICIPLIKTYKNVDEIKWGELPNSFVIKCNHGSGMNIVVKDKSKMNKDEVKAKLNKWMNKDFAFQNGYEMHYTLIKRQILVEEFKKDEKHSDLTDYKVWCFNGKPDFIQVFNNRTTNKYCNNYTLDWQYFKDNRIDLKSNPNALDPKPVNLDKMIEYSKILSEDFPFVRVDFYEINDELYLGELTFTPNSGIFRYRDNKEGLILGNKLKLPNA